MLVLAIDTATPSVTAGVARLPARSETPSLLAERVVIDGFAHAEQLIPLVMQAVDAAGLTLRDLDAIVVGLGPGPFTGLRVGIATAAALGDGLRLPVRGVPSHDGVARAAAPLAGDLLVVTDARRREVYLSGYRANGSRSVGPLVVAPSAVPGLLAAQAFQAQFITGPGAGLLDPYRDATFAPVAIDLPGASPVAGLVTAAAAALFRGPAPGPLTPLYLRRPDATEPGARKSVLGR